MAVPGRQYGFEAVDSSRGPDLVNARFLSWGQPRSVHDLRSLRLEQPTFACPTVTKAGGRLMAARESLGDILYRETSSVVAQAPRAAVRAGRSGWGLGTLLTAVRRPDDDLVLEHASLRIQVHRQTGGLLSVRRPTDRGNRLSQRLAARTTRPSPPPGKPWEDVSERAVYSDMQADSIRRIPAGEGRGEVIESRGRLIADKGREMGSFTQRIELVAGLPLALIDIEVRGVEPPTGPLFEQHLACRFAWNENEDLVLHRSLHTQSIATERGRFTAPWFIELSSPDDRDGRVAILTGGLPWHVRSSPHLLDCRDLSQLSADPCPRVR